MLLKIDPVIIKALNLKFENVSFTKLPKKIMINPKNIFGVAVPYLEFWPYWYMYQDRDFNKSIG